MSRALNETEEYFKKYYMEHPEMALDLPKEKGALTDLMEHAPLPLLLPDRHAPSKTLTEHMFFHTHIDFSIIPHERYMPANWHKHEFYEILIFLDGHGLNYTHLGMNELKKGDICIMAPGTSHALSIFNDDTTAYNLLIRRNLFETTFMNQLEGEFTLSSFFQNIFGNAATYPYVLFHTSSDPEIISVIHSILLEYQGHRRYKNNMLHILLAEFFLTLIRNHEQNIEIPAMIQSRQNKDTLYILHYIQNHYTSVTLHELSEYFHYSPRHLERLIYSATGLTFTRLLQSQRLAVASMLLKDDQFSISEICSQTGFSSEAHFRKIFKEKYHVTPSDYRKKMQLI